MLPINAFKVVSEFKFEIGAAMLGTQQLQNRVQSLQGSVDQVNFGLARMGVNLLTSSTGVSSFVGAIGSAISSADRFRHMQLDIATGLSANADKLTGPIKSLNEQLSFSGFLLEEIGSQARKFALPADLLAKNFNTVNNMLMAKGLAGDNFQNSIDLSRNLLKSASSLGIHPADVQGQLLRAIEGSASQGDTLFRRLGAETDAFKDLRGGNMSKLFNQLPQAERLERISKGMAQFANNSKILEERVNTLNGQTSLLRAFMGGDAILSVFRPLGQVLNRHFVKVLSKVNEVIDNQGRKVVAGIAMIVDTLIGEPKRFLINLLTFKDLMKNINRTKVGLTFLAVGGAIIALLKWLGLFRLAMVIFGTSMAAVTGMVAKALSLVNFAAIGRVLYFLGSAAGAVLAPLIALFTLFQLISRAIAIAVVRDLGNMPQLFTQATRILGKVTELFSQASVAFVFAFDYIAERLAVLFQFSLFARVVLESIEAVVDGFSMLASILSGIGTALGEFFAQVSMGNFTGLAKRVEDAFMEGTIAAWDQMQNNRGQAGGQGVVQNKVEMYVNMNNNFKETLEPDRVAFQVKEQLLKAATSRTQGRNGTFAFPTRATRNEEF